MNISKFVTIIMALQIIIATSTFANKNEVLPNSDLYFIASTTYYNSLLNYPTTLYQFNEKTLKLNRLRGITTQSQGSRFVQPYYDSHKVIIASLNNNEYLHLDIVNMKEPEQEKSVELAICDECAFTGGYFIQDDKSEFFGFNHIQMVNEQPRATLYGVDINSNENRTYALSKLEHVQSFGGSNGNFMNDRLPYLTVNNNKAVFTDALKIDLGWQLPRKLNLTNGTRFNQFINNQNIRVIHTFDSFNAKIQEFFVFDKHKKQWLSFKLNHKGWLKGFGYWLTTAQQTEPFNRNEELRHLIATQVKTNKLKHKHYLERFKQWDIDKTGLLHIINPIEDIHIKLDTKEPDSEVLLIENNQVIYRVADKIYSAKIKGKQLVKHQLLVQNDTVPAIHWAFFGGSSHVYK